MLPLCSIVVLNYNGEKLIKSTIESLLSLNYPKENYEIIVVDNASKDKSKAVINQYKEVKTIYLDHNLGFAGGNNVGIKAARGKYVVLLNNDCVVDRNWLKELVAIAEKDDMIAAVGSKTYLRDTKKIQNAGIIMFNDGYGRDRGAVVKGHHQDYEEDRGQYEQAGEIYAACGVAVLYRKYLLEKLGLLDETFFLYYEDVEVSERLRAHGYVIVYAPKAIVHHFHAASSGEWSPFFIYHSELGRLLHVFFWFPQRVFWREYLKFTAKAKLRIIYGLKNGQLKKQSQYLRVSWRIFTRFPQLYKIRSGKLKGLGEKAKMANYELIKDNKRVE